MASEAKLRPGAGAAMTKTAPDLRPEGWDSASASYERVIAPNTARYAEDLLRAAGVRAGERVLDVATGTGAFALLAARRGAKVLATDFAPEMVRRLEARAARDGIAGIETRVMDGQRLDLPDASFDAAASVFGLIFFPDRGAGLREMRRVLAPGGRAGIVAWSAPARVRVVSAVSDAVRAALPELPSPASTPPVFSMADAKRAEAEMLEAGFRDVRSTTLDHAWEFPTAESVWTDLAPASPVFAAMLATLPEEKLGRVHRALVESLRAEFGAGPVRLSGEAHVVVGTR